MGLWLTDLCEIVAIYLPWVPEDIFFLIDTDGSRRNPVQRGAKRRGEPFQTVSTVYFIFGSLRTDLQSQGTIY